MNSSKVKITALILICILVSTIIIISIKRNDKVAATLLVPSAKIDFLESYFRNINEYLDSFSKYSDIPAEHVLAAITSHHFLAKDFIAETFSGIDPKGITRIIIIGPDHFNQITGPVYMAQTTNTLWHTPFGNMDPDNELITAIAQNSEVYSDINLFRSEHSIYTLVPFAKKVFPDAKLVPLVLRQKNDYLYYYNLGEQISKTVDINKTVLIISSDFTHYSSIAKANENDRESISLLPDKKIDDIKGVTNDCKQCTAFLFGYLKNSDTKFKLIFNKNSFDISGKDPGNVTSYVGAYFTN